MENVISLANQKGGVGKTTSAINIATELALFGRKVLLIDLDPQGSATSGLGIKILENNRDLYDLFFGSTDLNQIIIQSQIDGLNIAPASSDLVSLEIELGKTPGRELILKSSLSLLKSEYDYILIDCPPSSGLLTLNALGASNKILIPLQAEYYALEGISALIKTIQFVQATFNPTIEILGVFLTMVDARTNLSLQVEREAREFFKERFFETKIPRSIKLSESPSHGLPMALYDANSIGAKSYKSLAWEIDMRCIKPIAKVANH